MAIRYDSFTEIDDCLGPRLLVHPSLFNQSADFGVHLWTQVKIALHYITCIVLHDFVYLAHLFNISLLIFLDALEDVKRSYVFSGSDHLL